MGKKTIILVASGEFANGALTEKGWNQMHKADQKILSWYESLDSSYGFLPEESVAFYTQSKHSPSEQSAIVLKALMHLNYPTPLDININPEKLGNEFPIARGQKYVLVVAAKEVVSTLLNAYQGSSFLVKDGDVVICHKGKKEEKWECKILQKIISHL